VSRSQYGGSYVSRGSHNDTRLPTNKSAETPLDLGTLDAGRTAIEGVVGSQSGAATLFYVFRTERSLRIALEPRELNSFTSPQIQWAVRRVDGGSGEMLESLDLYTRDQEGSGKGGFLISPGTFHVTVSTSSWYELPFACELVLREPPVTEATGLVELEVEARLNYPIQLPQSDAFADEVGRELDLEISARLIETVDMPRVFRFGYVRTGYWTAGYAINDGQGAGQAFGPDFALSVEASLSISTPANL
jgi:hypothetical protein